LGPALLLTVRAVYNHADRYHAKEAQNKNEHHFLAALRLAGGNLSIVSSA
jgi:hypothetical protein